MMQKASILALAALLAACGSTGTRQGLREPDNASRLRVAAAAEASGQQDVALSLYAAAAQAEPNRAEVQARLATALMRAGNAADAEAVLARALERQPSSGLLLTALGRLRLRGNAPDEALALFDRAFANGSRDASTLDARGMALDLLGRHEEAERDHRAALALAPGNATIANNLAMSLLLAGRAAEAVAVLEPIARRPGAPARVSTNLAVARAAAGGAALENALAAAGSGDGNG